MPLGLKKLRIGILHGKRTVNRDSSKEAEKEVKRWKTVKVQLVTLVIKGRGQIHCEMWKKGRFEMIQNYLEWTIQWTITPFTKIGAKTDSE